MQAVIKWKWLKSRLTVAHNNSLDGAGCCGRRTTTAGGGGCLSWGNTRTTTFQFSKIFIMLKCRLEANGAKRQSGNVPSKKVDSLPRVPEYPSTSTFYSTFCALVFPFPFCSVLSPWARKTFDAKLLGHCRATSSLSSSGSESQSHSQFRSQCCYPLSFSPFLSIFVLSPPIRPFACHLPRCIVQTFIKLWKVIQVRGHKRDSQTSHR